MKRRWLVIASLVTVLALIAAACGDDDDAETTTTAAATTTAAETTTTAAETTTTAAETTTTAAETTTTEAGTEVAFDVGVTAEPCPGSPNPGNGCIYLGVISDLSDGPFAAVAIPLTQAQEDFWAVVNAAGGLDGFDVAITPENTIDAHYDPGEHVAGYAQIAPNVAALAQTLGTPQTQAALPDYMADNMVGAPATWWSGWEFPEVDGNLILEAGTPYCLEAMNGFDFVVQAREGAPFSYAIAKFPGDYGEDYAAGVKIAAEANGLGDPVLEVQVIPFSAGGDATINEAIVQLATAAPDVIFLSTGPREMATILGGVYQAGHQTAMYVGVGPSWNTGLLAQEALLPLLEAAYFNTQPWAGWTYDSPGHAAMREIAEANGRTPNNGYVAGWVFQYNIKALLEQAIANGDLTRDGGGIVAAVGQLEDVDYEGMMPNRSFVGDPNDIVPRESMVGRVDATSPDGMTPATPYFAGPTASAYEFTAPCFSG
jgi:hypothetical protein